MSVATTIASGSAGPIGLRRSLSRFLGPLGLLAALLPFVTGGVALLLGAAVALTVGNPWPHRAQVFSRRLLSASIIGLGAGTNLLVVLRVGGQGLGYTAVGISLALLVGTWLGRRLRVLPDTALLVSVGTAICGGSAIAAVAPTLRAKDHEVSMALMVVFLLNAVALFVFPLIGHSLAMDQESFGLWCALAIHDTSSVVGAASQYGARALEIATAAKLARALWIIPVTLLIAWLRAASRPAASDEPKAAPPRPWFIAGFIASAALVTFIPALAPTGDVVAAVARRMLTVSLFLVGLGLSRRALAAVGVRPLALAVVLWVVLAGVSLAAVTQSWI